MEQMLQIPLFDLSAIPCRPRCSYLRGWSPRMIRDLPLLQAHVEQSPGYLSMWVCPSLLRPTQRTFDPKLVRYYELTQRVRDSEGNYPVVVRSGHELFLLNGHHRWMANLAEPRLHVHLYDLPKNIFAH